MRIRLLLIAAVLAAPAVTAGSGASAAAPERCAKSKTTTTTIARNGQVRVYRKGKAQVYACHLKSGRARLLGVRGFIEGSDVSALSELRLAGRFVAFDEAFGCDRHSGDCGGTVVVLDVRNGRRVYRLSVQDSQLAGEPPSQVPDLSDLDLRPGGTAALIIGPTEAGELEVWKLGPQGNVRLDHGADVERGSLATSDRWVYWRKGGQASAGALD